MSCDQVTLDWDSGRLSFISGEYAIHARFKDIRRVEVFVKNYEVETFLRDLPLAANVQIASCLNCIKHGVYTLLLNLVHSIPEIVIATLKLTQLFLQMLYIIQNLVDVIKDLVLNLF